MLVLEGGTSSTKRGWAERALQRLQEQLVPLGVELNKEKTKVVDLLKGKAFGFLGFDLRSVRKRKRDGYFILMTPEEKGPYGNQVEDPRPHPAWGCNPGQDVDCANQRRACRLGPLLQGGPLQYSSRAFSEARDCVEMKIRTLLTRRKRRRKSSVGWQRWSNEYLYGVLGLYWDWTVRPLPRGREPYVNVAAVLDKTHNPFGETRWVSCLRENLTSSSYGEGLETDRPSTQVPRQSLTRQRLFAWLHTFRRLVNRWEYHVENFLGMTSSDASNCWRGIYETASSGANEP